MRALEIGVVAALLPYIVHLLSPSQGSNVFFKAIPFLALVLAICQIVIEGYRWQMMPAYALAVAFAANECARAFGITNPSFIIGIVGLCFEVSAIILATVLPVFQVPTPTGPYKVGTQVRYIVDETRRDFFSDTPDRGREMIIQIWYPADPLAYGEMAPYRDKRITRFTDAHFALAMTHSILEAPIAKSQGRYPVVVYAPSWTGIRTESTYQVEELASHGYVVVAMDHPYSSRITVFPDSRIARRKFTGEEDYSSQAGFESFVRTADQQVDIRARDASFVLDTLELLNTKDPQHLLAGQLDLEHAGIFGFSFGGATAAEACWRDHRFKAGLSLDGMIAGEAVRHGTTAPFLFIFGDGVPQPLTANLSQVDDPKRRQLEFDSEQLTEIRSSLAKSGGYWIVMPGMNHLDFSDVPFFSPLRFSGLPFSSRPRLNPAEAERDARSVSRYVLAFFDERLKGADQKVSDGPAAYPGVFVQAWKKGIGSQTPAR